MKTIYKAGIGVIASMLLIGCGGNNSETTASNASSGYIMNVQRGPIIGAKVIDSSGQIAKQIGSGKYKFASKPVYPVLVSGGYIDVDRDGKISVGDVKNDLNLTTPKGSAVTLLTTLEVNPKSKSEIENLAKQYGLSVDDICNKVPDDSREVEALSNVIYKYIKDNKVKNLLNENETKLQTLSSLKGNVDSEIRRYKNNSSHNPKDEEKILMDNLKRKGDDIKKVGVDIDLTTAENEVKKVKREMENGLDNVTKKEIENELNHVKNLIKNTTGTGGNTGGNTTGGNTTTAVSFANTVYPVFKNKCQICHTSGGVAAGFPFQVLSTASATYNNIITNSLVNTTSAASSILLQKGSNAVPHRGGNALGTSYNTVLSWIQQGAQNN